MPRLESWERRDDPAQVALREFVSYVHELIDPAVEALDGPLAFHLHVALPDQFDPLWERDLDNYLFPIARTLPARVVSVWGTKGRGTQSSVRLQKPIPAPRPSPMFAVPRSSVSEAAWKVAVHGAVEEGHELPEGPLGLQLGYTVGPELNWPSLWKPSIDGLSPLLGRTYPDRDWNPLDGRIVRLGLHKSVDLSYGREASMDIYAASAEHDWPELAWLTNLSEDQRAGYFEQHRAKQRVRIERAACLRPAHVPRRSLSNVDIGSEQVRVFRDDDAAYLSWIAANPRGFVLNIRRSLNPVDARLHRAECWTIASEPGHGKLWTGPYLKLCATELRALEDWAAEGVGAPVVRCRICLPAAA